MTTTMEAPTTTTSELVVQDFSRSEIISDTIKQIISTTTTAKAPVTKTPTATTTEVTTTSAPIETTSITMSKITDSKVYEMKFNESQKLDQASRALPSDPQNRTPTRNVFYILGKLPEGVSYFIGGDTLGLNMKNEKRCDNISSDWSCSSDYNQHSVCIRTCLGNSQSESIKCKCKHHLCQWVQKGISCTWTTRRSNKGNLEWDDQSSQKMWNDVQLDENQDDTIKSQSSLGENLFGHFSLEQQATEQVLDKSKVPSGMTVGSANFGRIILKGDVVFNMNYNL